MPLILTGILLIMTIQQQNLISIIMEIFKKMYIMAVNFSIIMENAQFVIMDIDIMMDNVIIILVAAKNIYVAIFAFNAN
jgi:hypothetical protein